MKENNGANNKNNGTNNKLEGLFSRLEHFINSKTVIGEPIHIGKTIILPLIEVGFGMGGTHSEPGGGGMGAKITPSAVLVIDENTSQVQLVNIKNQDALGKIIDMAPGIVSKIQDFFKGEINEEDLENKVNEAILKSE